MWHISFMGNKKNQEFKNDVLPKNSKKITNNSFFEYPQNTGMP